MGITELRNKLTIINLMSQQRIQNSEMELPNVSSDKLISNNLDIDKKVSSDELINSNLNIDRKSESKWIKPVGTVALTLFTAIIGAIIGVELIYKPQIFNSAVTQVNSDKKGDRNTGITILKGFFEDRNPIRTITTSKTPSEREWEIIEILATSIKTYYLAPVPLNINDEARRKKYDVGPDLQNALDIISGVKFPRTDSVNKEIKLDDSNLYKAKLENAQFSNAIFNRSYLYLVRLDNAKLMNAHFNGAYLRGANLTNADLTDADLTNADLHSAIMEGAKFTNQQIMKSCYWAQAKYDDERLKTLPPKSYDNSTSNPLCDKDISKKIKVSEKQKRYPIYINRSSVIKAHKKQMQHSSHANRLSGTKIHKKQVRHPHLINKSSVIKIHKKK